MRLASKQSGTFKSFFFLKGIFKSVCVLPVHRSRRQDVKSEQLRALHLKVCNCITPDSGGFQTPKLAVSSLCNIVPLIHLVFSPSFLDAIGTASFSLPSTLFHRKKSRDGETLLSVDRLRQDAYGCVNMWCSYNAPTKIFRAPACQTRWRRCCRLAQTTNQKILTQRCYSCGLICDPSV